MKPYLFVVAIQILLSGNLFSQNTGIGTVSPNARLEVRGVNNFSSANSFIASNSLGDTIVRIRNDGKMTIGYNGTNLGRTLNVGGNGINWYRTDINFAGAIFPTDSSLVLWSEFSDTNYVILQPSWGRVGVGTYSPDAKFHVGGTTILGANGTVITNIIKTSISKNIASVLANTSNVETFAVSGAATGSTVYVSPGSALADGLIIAYARVSAVNTVEVKFTNISAGSINPSTMVFNITVIE